MVVVLSTRMGSLLGRFGPTPLTGLAFTCLVLAYAVFLRAGVHPDYPAVMLPATLLVGLAFGLGFSSLSVAATAGVPNAEQGLAASLFQTSFQVGGALVLAIVTAVIDAGGAGRISSASATLAAYRPALGLITGIAAIGMLVALSGLRRQPVQPEEPADDLTPDDLAVGELAVGDLAPRELEARELAARGLTGSVGEDLRGGSSDSRRV
jgi:MFS family permease